MSTTTMTCPENFICTPTNEWVWGTTLTLLGLVLAVAVPTIVWLIGKISEQPSNLTKPLGATLTVIGMVVALVGVAMVGTWHLQLAIGFIGVLVLAWVIIFAFVKGVAGLTKTRV